jgi:hypothetical protein
MDIPKPKDEPVWYAGIGVFLASILVPLAAKQGITLDPQVVSAAIGSLVLLLVPLLRSKVHANPKVEQMVGAARAEGVAIGSARGPQ